MSYSAELYMHDLDRKAFAALNQFPKFIKLQEAYLANTDEKASKIELLSTGIRLSENQMPEIYNLLPPICENLEISVPDLYMVQSRDKKDLNAFTGGVTQPFVCVTSELVKQFSPEMIASVIAHECGHIACKHYLYHSLARNFANGIASSPLAKIPAVNKYLSKTLVTALLFWDRCSELSADRAAVLCDGGSERTVDMLLKIHGFDDSINREEFIKQAIDLRDFVNGSKSNQIMEQMIVQWNSHPLLATRAYECYDWEKSNQYKGIIDGTYTVNDAKAETEKSEEAEVINANVSIRRKEEASTGNAVPPEAIYALEKRLQQVNNDLARYTNYADGFNYAMSIAYGIVAGIVDAELFADANFVENDIGFSHKQVNKFIEGYAKSRGLGGDRLKDCISDLEQAFKVAQDNVWKGANIGVSAKNHHLADLAHHPTLVGLVSALIVQFLRIGTFVNKDGEWHFIFVETTKEDIITIAGPALITGILNWLVYISENKYEAETGKELPEGIHKLAHVVASTPEIVEIVKCADNWFGHLVSDMGGSKNTAGAGMGIPGVFISLLHELSSLPILKDSGLPEIINDLYVNQKIDLRHELAFVNGLDLRSQAEPVIFCELFTRLGFMLLQLEKEIIDNGFKGINWRHVIPFANRSVDRCLAISFMTFNVVDTADAAMRAAIESGGNWVIFSGRFVARYNFVGAGRAALAIVKEVSNENKEAQLIHERMLLMNTKAQIMYQQLQEFKANLEEKVSDYLAEDIAAFIEGFDYMNEGLASGDSDLVIKGNVIIQKVLGREPQFTTQEEFDTLMESDIPLEF